MVLVLPSSFKWIIYMVVPFATAPIISFAVCNSRRFHVEISAFDHPPHLPGAVLQMIAAMTRVKHKVSSVLLARQQSCGELLPALLTGSQPSSHRDPGEASNCIDMACIHEHLFTSRMTTTSLQISCPVPPFSILLGRRNKINGIAILYLLV